MKTAGLTLDFYDDVNGELLKSSFPTPEALPEIIKTAHILSSEEREVLRDEAFALVMVNEGKVFRKFACVDPGNTLLSALYFSQNAESLPEEAQKIAAANIIAACEEFGMEIQDLEKMAAAPPKGEGRGATRKRDPMLQPVAGDEANWAERTNLISVRGGADSGRVIPTASQMKTAGKGFETAKNLTRTAIEQVGENLPTIAATAGLSTAGSRLVAKQERHKKANFEEEHGIKDDNKINLDSFHKLNPGSKPKAKKKVANIVDVSALEPAVKLKTASPTHTALGHYPLDSFEEVQAAVQYFSDNYLGLTPGQRHEFAVKTASRAEDLGIELPAVLDRYGSNEYAPDVEAHLANRRALAPDHKDVWNALQEKRASIGPESFVELLSEADEEAGLNWLYDGQVADPFFATFGGNKVKEANAAWSWQSSVGDYVSAHQLKKLALNGRPLVSKQFDEAFAVAFAKDPITMFESMPDLHKKILARLAAQEHDGLNNN